jgi:hypothetical protein
MFITRSNRSTSYYLLRWRWFDQLPTLRIQCPPKKIIKSTLGNCWQAVAIYVCLQSTTCIPAWDRNNPRLKMTVSRRPHHHLAGFRFPGWPSNNRLFGYGYRLLRACIRLGFMSYRTNTVKGICNRLTDIENTDEETISRIYHWYYIEELSS